MTRRFPLTLVLLAITALAFGGCASESANAPSRSQDSAPLQQAGNAEHDHPSGDHSGHQEVAAGSSDMDKMKSELAKLPPKDQASAEEQHFCPVSGKMLGTMGAPYRVDINEQEVWLCCPGCESQLRDNPDKFLAKLQN